MKQRTIIKTDKDYQKALNRIENVFDAKPNTKEGEELELLSLLIENYEKKEIYIDFSDPISMIRNLTKKLQISPEILIKAY